MSNFEFHNPWFLLCFLVFIPIILRDFLKNKNTGVPIPNVQNIKKTRWFHYILFFLKFFKYLTLFCIIIAMARPRSFTIDNNNDKNKGIDIMLAVDVSLSMLSKDLEPDRLRALQKIAVNFVQSRPFDRIGLVTYSGEALTKVPVTIDHDVLIDEIKNIDPMELNPGTSIGDGLSVAVNHLKNSKSKSKVIILMTDGVNTIENALPISVAAELAKSQGIKVYTIGVGTNGYAPMPTGIDPFGDLIFNNVKVQIDEEALMNIAQQTGGSYFRAISTDGLGKIYADINQLEFTDFKTKKVYQYTEHFQIFLLFALALLLMDTVFRWLIFKSII